MVHIDGASPAWEKHVPMLRASFLHSRILCQEAFTPCRMDPTEVLCAWSAPKSRKVEARPLRTVPIIKAVSGGRKETTKWDRELNFSNYDPREEKHRKLGRERAC